MPSQRSILVLILAALVQGCADAPVVPSAAPAAASHKGPGEGIQKPLAPACADPGNAPTHTCSRTVDANFDGGGTLWIAWEQNGNVYVQSSTDKGKSFSEPVAVTRAPEAVLAHGEYRPKVKAGPDGTVYVSWNVALAKRHSGDIRFSRSRDGGKTFSEPVVVNTNRDIIGHRFDEMLIGPDGKLAIFWLDGRDAEAAKAKNLPHDGSSMYYAWSDDRGEHFFTDAKVTDNTCQCCRISSETDSDGLPVVTWRHVFAGNIRDHALLKFKRWNEPGHDMQRVSFGNWKIEACPHHGPGLAIDPRGRFHAVWFDNAEKEPGLYYAFSDDKGRHFSQPLHFGDVTKAASHPDVGALDKSVAITWTEYDGRQNKLLAIKSTDGGLSWTRPKTVAFSDSESDNAFVINDGTRLYASWHQHRKGYYVIDLINF